MTDRHIKEKIQKIFWHGTLFGFLGGFILGILMIYIGGDSWIWIALVFGFWFLAKIIYDRIGSKGLK